MIFEKPENETEPQNDDVSETSELSELLLDENPPDTDTESCDSDEIPEYDEGMSLDEAEEEELKTEETEEGVLDDVEDGIALSLKLVNEAAAVELDFDDDDLDDNLTRLMTGRNGFRHIQFISASELFQTQMDALEETDEDKVPCYKCSQFH